MRSRVFHLVLPDAAVSAGRRRSSDRRPTRLHGKDVAAAFDHCRAAGNCGHARHGHSEGLRLEDMAAHPQLGLALLLHTSTPSIWSEPWSWEPAIVAPLLLMLAIYTIGALRRGSLAVLRWRHTSFWAGWFTLALALTSPIHELGEQLFSAH